MKRTLLIALTMLAVLTSCGPLTYTLPVEKRSESEAAVDFAGTLPGIVTLTERGDSDSALLAALAIGMAERLEQELGLDSKVMESGWRSLTAKESGRIGGLMTKRKREIKSQALREE